MTSYTINTILLIGCVASSYLFVFLYAAYSSWYKNVVGRHIMAFTFLLAIILTYLLLARAGVLRSLTDPWPSVIATVIYASLFVILFRQTWILIHVQLRPRRRNRRRARKEHSNER